MSQSDMPQLPSHYKTTIPSDFSPTDPADSIHAFTNDGFSAWVGLLVLLSSLALCLLSLRRWKSAHEPAMIALESHTTWSSKLALDVPCRHCHYFQANRYLACAVNPMQALTPEAANCGDFEESVRT